MMSMYDSFSSDYDRFVSWPGRLAFEMPFIEQTLQRLTTGGQKPTVVDAACGTGMHAVELARRGYPTAGADVSAGMVDVARQNARKSGTVIDFRQAGFGEMTSAFGKDSFDALLCLGNSLPHVQDRPALVSAIADFAACLRPGGILLLQNRNFDAVMAAKERWMEPQSHREGDREWLFLRFYDFDPDGSIGFNILSLTRQQSQGWQQSVNRTRLYPFLSGELQQVLDDTGFRSIEFYGSMGGEPFDQQRSGNLVVVAWK